MSRQRRGPVPRRASYYRPGPRPRSPEPVDETIAELIGRFGAPGMAGGRVVAAWPRLAGEWATRATPVGVRDGVLTVEVGNGADAAVLRFDAGAIRAKIDQEIGPGIVSRIRVRVAR